MIWSTKSPRSGILISVLLCLCVLPRAWSQEYRIGPGDVLTITVWGQPDLSRDYTVDPDGFTPFPLINRVRAGGLTTRELAATLVALLGKDYLVDPQVIVSVKEYLSQKVTILGETARPGVFYLTGPTTLVDVLSKAGWLSKNAGKQILVVRDQPLAGLRAQGGDTTILRLNVDKLQAGNNAENVRVQAGDTIFVVSRDENN